MNTYLSIWKRYTHTHTHTHTYTHDVNIYVYISPTFGVKDLTNNDMATGQRDRKKNGLMAKGSL